MLVLPALHDYLSQLLSPPPIHTALLLTPEGALVSYASQTSTTAPSTHGSRNSPSSSINALAAGLPPASPSSITSNGSSGMGTPRDAKPDSVASVETRVAAPQRSKDEIRMVAGLGAELWAETRAEGQGMVESELGRILVVAVEDEEGGGGEGAEPLLLLAVNGTSEADWDTMGVKARKLAAFLAPSVNKHRGSMGRTTATTTIGVGSRTQSSATSPGRGLSR